MPEKKQIIYRCPVCLQREVDVVIRSYDGVYRCTKCSFTGSLEDIQAMYRSIKSKYRWITRRITMEDLEKME